MVKPTHLFVLYKVVDRFAKSLIRLDALVELIHLFASGMLPLARMKPSRAVQDIFEALDVVLRSAASDLFFDGCEPATHAYPKQPFVKAKKLVDP